MTEMTYCVFDIAFSRFRFISGMKSKLSWCFKTVKMVAANKKKEKESALTTISHIQTNQKCCRLRGNVKNSCMERSVSWTDECSV